MPFGAEHSEGDNARFFMLCVRVWQSPSVSEEKEQSCTALGTEVVLTFLPAGEWVIQRLIIMWMNSHLFARFSLSVGPFGQEADRAICAASAVHQADQTCRRIISQTMKEAKGTWGTAEVQHSQGVSWHRKVNLWNPSGLIGFPTLQLWPRQYPSEAVPELLNSTSQSYGKW